MEINLQDYVTNPGAIPGLRADNPFMGTGNPYPCATYDGYANYFTGVFCASAKVDISGLAFVGFPPDEFAVDDDPNNPLDDNQEAANTYIGLTKGADGSKIHDVFGGFTANGAKNPGRPAAFTVQTDPSAPLQAAHVADVEVTGIVASGAGGDLGEWF